MTSQRLATKCPQPWKNQGVHDCHYGLGALCAHVEQMHTDLTVMTIMQDIHLSFYTQFRKARMYVCMLCYINYYSYITISFSFLQVANNQAHNQER